MEFISIGKIGRPRGIKGEFFIHPLTDFPDRFKSLDSVYISDSTGNRNKYT
ncbi:hypothetical protein DRQ09_10300, partial [candidate division KSB1 bacterium]